MELLRRFIRDRSETAFRGLVELHSPLVYATALRRLGGDRAAAQDVMQEVFTLLARKAVALQSVQLGGWLYRQTCRRAANHARAESRRKAREAVVAIAGAGHGGAESDHPDLSGEVDEALLTLPGADRDALVMRYFEARDYRNVGGALGISEEAARKRVTRALEKLTAVLKRRGIATSGALLGTSMSSMGRVAPPEAMVATVSMRAMQSLPAAGSSFLLSLLKPVLAGVALTSLVAGGLLLKPQPAVALAAPAAAAAHAARSDLASLLRPVKDAPLEDLIAEIKRTKAGPGHSLVTLRVKAILDRIAIADIPAFIALAREKLTVDEQGSCFEPLLTRWLDQDAEAALDYVLHNSPGKEVDDANSTSMFGNLFRRLFEKDLSQADAWLRKHWGDPQLNAAHWTGSVGGSFAMSVADAHQWQSGPRQALDFILALPDADARRKCLRGLAGNEPYCSAWYNTGPERLLELHRALADYPDPLLAGEARMLLWQNLNRSRPDVAAKMMEALNPQERFEASLAKTGHYAILASETEGPGSGRTSHYEQVKDSAPGEAAAMAAGLAAGHSRGETLEAIGDALVWKGDPAVAAPWLEQHREEVQIDSTLMVMIRDRAACSDESAVLLWASCLSDPGLRLSLCRGAFRKLLAEPAGNAARAMDNPALPADLREELGKLRGEEAP